MLPLALSAFGSNCTCISCRGKCESFGMSFLRKMEPSKFNVLGANAFAGVTVLPGFAIGSS